MDPIVIGTIALVACIAIMFIGMPVPFAMLLTGIGALMFLRSPAAAFQVVASDLFTNFASYTLTVAPMFGFMGLLACYSGIGSSMFTAALVLSVPAVCSRPVRSRMLACISFPRFLPERAFTLCNIL